MKSSTVIYTGACKIANASTNNVETIPKKRKIAATKKIIGMADKKVIVLGMKFHVNWNGS